MVGAGRHAFDEEKKNEASIRVSKPMVQRSGFGDFYNNVKHFDRPSVAEETSNLKLLEPK